MKYIDMDLAMHYLMGNATIFQQLKNNFLENHRDYALDFQRFNQTKDIPAATLYIHSLKGISLNLGAKQMYDDAVRVLEKLKKETWDQTLIDRFYTTLDESIRELKKI